MSGGAGLYGAGAGNMTRWATFDCYGTLIDWNGGIRAELARVFGETQADAQLRRYHALEPELEADGMLTYREVLTEAMLRLGAPPGEEGGLAGSLPGWQPFPETRAALAAARDRGWKLAILSNTDPDLLEASQELIGVPFEETIAASAIRSYKPAQGHWREFARRTGAAAAGHVHVGASLFHDIAPATRLGLRTVWINRLGETAGPEPTRELKDLRGLAGTLDELIPSRHSDRLDGGDPYRCQGRASGGPRGRSEASEHLPRLRVALPRRRAAGGPVRL
jgi:2-haloacid dehalogenase